MANRTVTVTLEGRPGGLIATFGLARKAGAELGAEFEKLAVKNNAGFNKLTNVGMGMGLALVGAFALAEKAAFAFDKQMSATAAVMDRTGLTSAQFTAQVDQMRQAAIQAGRDTAFTATQAAQGEEELAKAGISTADILSGGLKGALTLASAGTLDLADSAKYASQAMVEFGLKGKDVAHIADVLTAGANKSVTDVQGLGEALGQTGTVAHQAGMNLDETVGVLALFSQHGLDGVEAGTTFKQMLLKLEGPSNKAAGLMKSLGIEVYDSNGKFKSAADLADTLQKSLGGLTDEQRNYALSVIFGSRAVRGAVDLYNAGKQGVNDWTAAVNDSGIAQRTADEKLNNLSGDVKKLEGSLQALAITSTGGVNTGLRFMAQGAEGLVNAFSDLPTGIQSTVTVLSALTGTSLLAAAGFGKVYGSVKSFRTTLEGMGPLGTKVSGLVGTLGKFGVVAAIASAAGFGIFELFKAMGDAAKPAKMNIDDVTTSLNTFALTGRTGGDLAKAFGEDLSGVTAKARELDAALKVAALPVGMSREVGAAIGPHQKAVDTVAQITQNFKDADAGLKQLVDNGNTQAAATDFSAFAMKLEKAGWDMTRINALFPQYTKAAATASQSTNAVAQGFASVAEAGSLMNGTLSEAIQVQGSLTNVEKALHGATVTLMGAVDGLYASYDAATAAIKANGKTAINNHTALDATTAKGRANREALLGIADAATKAAQATLDQTNDVDKANQVITDARAVLIKDAEAMGLSKTAAERLADSLLKLPPLTKAAVETPGLTRAITQVGQLRTEIDKLHGKVVNVTITHGNVLAGGSQASVNRWGGAYEHARMGTLREASYYSATNPGRYMIAEPATRGEYFVPKSGNYGRSMNILGRAAANYGASVVPGGWRGGVQVVHVHFTAAPGAAAAHFEQLRAEVSHRGGPIKAFATP